MSENAKSVLVCYATGTGCTKGVAERIGETLADSGLRAAVVPFESDPEPSGYDAIVAGSGVRAGAWHPVANKWMKRNAVALRAKPVALFAVGMAPADIPPKPEETAACSEHVAEKTGLAPIRVGAFAGMNDPSKFNVFERAIVRIVGSPVGDFRDWTAIEEWANGVASELAGPVAASGSVA
jgi:menaquinone-dependent protoporphyrinogen oxidase